MFGQVVRDSGCDEDWNFHVDPANVHFADVTIEICDGRPSYIEANLDEWISTVKSWCPWSGRVVSIDEH